MFLAKDMQEAMTALGRQVGGSQLGMFVVWGFLVGIFAVWLYAAIRPRYGAGPKAALCAGAAVWGLGYLLAAATPIALHLFPRHIMAMALRWGSLRFSSERSLARGFIEKQPPDPHPKGIVRGISGSLIRLNGGRMLSSRSRRTRCRVAEL